MNKRIFLTVLFSVVLVISAFAQDLKQITLLPPQKEGGKPLMQALNERKTSREFDANKKLTDQQLSNLLWAAFGVNRTDGKRTAPTAMNKQETDVYVVLDKGIFVYNAEKNTLDPVVAGDFRKDMGKQDFVASASVVLVFVADYDKMNGDDKTKDFYSAVDVGYISQNVYLFAASENMNSVVLGWIDRDAMVPVLKLKKNQKIILSQCVGLGK
ncbi:MAG: SagB/ThcOx family dehydrogenase [Bacteroidota bacterium]